MLKQQPLTVSAMQQQARLEKVRKLQEDQQRLYQFQKGISSAVSMSESILILAGSHDLEEDITAISTLMGRVDRETASLRVQLEKKLLKMRKRIKCMQIITDILNKKLQQIGEPPLENYKINFNLAIEKLKEFEEKQEEQRSYSFPKVPQILSYTDQSSKNWPLSDKRVQFKNSEDKLSKPVREEMMSLAFPPKSHPQSIKQTKQNELKKEYQGSYEKIKISHPKVEYGILEQLLQFGVKIIKQPNMEHLFIQFSKILKYQIIPKSHILICVEHERIFQLKSTGEQERKFEQYIQLASKKHIRRLL